MIISPLPKHRAPSAHLAILSKEGKTLDSCGEVATVETCSAPVIFCDSPMRALNVARSVGGEAIISRTRGGTRWLRFHIAGRTIFPGVPFGVAELTAFAEYAAKLGIHTDSLQVMGFNLMRHTLGGYIDAAEGTGIPFNRFPPGARLHGRKGSFSTCVQCDLTAAYLWGIGRVSVARRFTPVTRIHLNEVAGTPGAFALVNVRVPKSEYGYIPALSAANTTYFPNVKGWIGLTLLPSEVLMTCHENGYDVRLRKAWLPHGVNSTPFYAFAELIRKLRAEPFGKVAKQVGNTVWGSFGASADTAIVKFVPGSRRHKITNLPPRAPKCYPIAANVVEGVRSKVANTVIHPSTVQVHTDGFISLGDRTPNFLGVDNEPGDWRVVNFYREVEVIDAAWWRAIDATGATVYRTAGRPGTEKTFEHRKLTEKLAEHRGMFS